MPSIHQTADSVTFRWADLSVGGVPTLSYWLRSSDPVVHSYLEELNSERRPLSQNLGEILEYFYQALALKGLPDPTSQLQARLLELQSSHFPKEAS